MRLSGRGRRAGLSGVLRAAEVAQAATAALQRAALAAGPSSMLYARVVAPLPPAPEQPCDARALKVSWVGAPERQTFRAEDGPIYVDGSCLRPLRPLMAQAGCAAVQVGPSGAIVVAMDSSRAQRMAAERRVRREAGPGPAGARG